MANTLIPMERLWTESHFRLICHVQHSISSVIYYFLVSCIQLYHKITHKFNTLFQRKSSKGIQRFEKRTEWYIRRWKGKSYFTCIVLAILKTFIFSRLYVWVLIPGLKSDIKKYLCFRHKVRIWRVIFVFGPFVIRFLTFLTESFKKSFNAAIHQTLTKHAFIGIFFLEKRISL